ncbi:hypothetical protein GEV33_015506 [Tenebrio molitor]|uniref:glutamate dehydrogenase [NAD(P)(+)] n=1 Tax=Tenebrio molitor TaxID=7067 RepID=A0A8J6L0G5_TENMO|nr:hypothetical protein GEV33_015512 [Tenebrio molitor]KAH0807285.1 hypothetical protein GEV33_015506 [Tenebrio molitor]
MACKNTKILNSFAQTTSYSTYEIPERYRNSFYLANAALFDQANWFLHRAYEICFPRLVSRLKDRQKMLTDSEANKKVMTAVHLLDQCNSIIDVRFPIDRENGKKEIVRGFRAQHGLFSGFDTCLGGLRMKEDVTRDQMKGLAMVSTYKHSCMGIRLAGAHGGIKIDPKQYTELELQRIVKKYAAELYTKGFCDGLTDVIEPDVNVGAREMAWIASIFPAKYEKVMVAGKPTEMGGIDNYPRMASQGIFFALDHFINNDKILEQINMTKGLEQKTFIIQGLGKLGSALAKFLENCGAVCVGVKEHDGYVYDAEGVDIQGMIRHRKQLGTIQNFTNVKPIASDEIFKEHCDILILAAQQKGLICYVADKVKAKIVVEAANCSITPTAHRILMGRSKLVLPDIYVSSGHSVASYIEYLFAWRKAKKDLPVLRHLYKHILTTFNVTKKTRQVVSSATTQKIIDCDMKPDILTYAIEHVMSETGNDNLLTHLVRWDNLLALEDVLLILVALWDSRLVFEAAHLILEVQWDNLSVPEVALLARLVR